MVPMASDTRSAIRGAPAALPLTSSAESGAGTASDKSWDRVSLTAKKLMVLARYSSEMNEDAVINMGDDLAGEIAYAFAVKEDNCGFIGDGSSTYGGMQGVTTKIKGLSGTIANIAGLVVATGTGYASSYGSTCPDRFRGRCRQASGVRRHAAGEMVHATKRYYWNVAWRSSSSRRAASPVPRSKGLASNGFLGYDVEFVQVMPKRSGGQPGLCIARRSQPGGQLR
jgi:hypothetical protein